MSADNHKLNRLIGVIAGTKVDTQMGVDFLHKHHIKTIGLSISDNPQAQTRLQALDKQRLTKLVLEAIQKLIQQGVDQIIIYCNSLSSTINLDFVRQKVAIKIITPLEVYAQIAKKYQTFGLIAANCQVLANLEQFILDKNPQAVVLGYGNLKLVYDIEAHVSPRQIIKRHNLVSVCRYLHQSGAQIIILGCTHFSYIYSALRRLIQVNLFEPSLKMRELL